jgi:hypothetical protein
MSLDRLMREAVRVLPLVTNILAWLGVVIIAYGIVSAFTGETWRPLERQMILPIAATLTLVAVLLHAVLVYLPVRITGPGPASRYTVAPAIIVISLAGLFLIWYRGLPVPVVLGFAIVALAWSLPRAASSEPAPQRLL